MRSGVQLVAMSSAICSPPAGMPLKPHVPQPVEITNPSTPVTPMIGEKSAEMSHLPVHWRRILRLRTNGSNNAIFSEHDCRNWNEDWRGELGLRPDSGPIT